MKAFRFHAIICEDRIIRVPPDVDPLPREAEVILLQPEEPVRPATPSHTSEASPWPLVHGLAKAAEELGGDDLPTDLAANHDHYLYGCPKTSEAP